MATYTTPTDDQERLLVEVMQTYHQRLVGVGVTIGMLVAYAPVDKEGNPTGSALKVRGVPALAKVRIVPLPQRVAGLCDAEITIDGDRWTFLSREERLAVLDHELTHLDVQADGDDVVRDDHGRPKLKMRPHDHEFGWFDEVAERHKGNSIEAQQAQAFVDNAGQLYLGFTTATEADALGLELAHEVA